MADFIAEASKFVEEKTGTKIDNFGDDLKSGVVLCNLANAIEPGAIGKISQAKMPFMQRENIQKFCEWARKFGVPDNENFMTIDLFEAQNLRAVALTIRAVKIKSGGGFEKAAAGAAPPMVDLGTGSDAAPAAVSLSETPTVLATPDGDVKRLGDAKLAGHAKLSEATGVRKCDVCTKPITGACISAVNKTFHAKCFLCRRCNVVLAEKKYYEHNNKQYCDRCILIENPQTSVKGVTSSKSEALFSK